MDQQAEELDQELANARIERVGEGIKITFDSGILFDSNQSTLRSAAQANLTNLATVLQKYSDTDIIVYGHTDSDGSEEHNLELSRQRAQAVQNYLAGLNVDPTRFSILGMGEGQPVASNESAEGKQQNRRVELAIMANEELKRQAEQQVQG
jgi:outer membrane protein OmpA-like peptidoglycan-associated protein